MHQVRKRRAGALREGRGFFGYFLKRYPKASALFLVEKPKPLKQLASPKVSIPKWKSTNVIDLSQTALLSFLREEANTQHPDVEQTILDEVGSYGQQLGRIGDALEVLLTHVKLEGLRRDEKDALTVLQGQLAEVRQVKQRALKEALPQVESARAAFTSRILEGLAASRA
jgi:hypothetical protein